MKFFNKNKDLKIEDLEKFYMVTTDLPLKNGEACDSMFFERTNEYSELAEKFGKFTLREGISQSIRHNLPIYNCLNMPKEHIKLIENYYISCGGKRILLA